ncbi:hypothetical protein ACU635_29925 [[Actinomadura] parvosata]|uniref:hypothetical protein n=1 Tax=[Actinomadura] parvosata TaxID=1955412 RepID=UPI00406D1689
MTMGDVGDAAGDKEHEEIIERVAALRVAPAYADSSRLLSGRCSTDAVGQGGWQVQACAEIDPLGLTAWGDGCIVKRGENIRGCRLQLWVNGYWRDGGGCANASGHQGPVDLGGVIAGVMTTISVTYDFGAPATITCL